jgi:hypothetical protein
MRVLSFDVGIKNLSFAHLEVTDETATLLEWQILSVTEDNCKNVSIETLVENVLMTLQSHFGEDFFTNTVLIENQPSLKNGLMKTVSVVIYTYFNMLKIQYGNVDSVKFISATNKLKCKRIKELNLSGKMTYKDRKKASIELATLYLCPEKKEWLGKQKKADDASDAFCQAIYYIEHVMKIPEHRLKSI